MQGISLLGLQAGSTIIETLARMPRLRILILDGVRLDSMLTGSPMPSLAMLSWRDAGGPDPPVAFETIKFATVLDMSGSAELESLTPDLQASLALQSLCILCSCLASRENTPGLL